jgi:hypothetical protein
MEIRRPIPFAGSQLDGSMHVCAFFNSTEEEYGVLLPFIKDGFACGEKAIHIVSPNRRHSHLKCLQNAGLDTVAAQKSGQLDLRLNTETYLKDGRFDKSRMLEVFEKVANSNASGLFSRSRIVCHMDWATSDHSQAQDLIEFESRVNYIWRIHDDAVICVYDLAKIGGDVVIDIMRTHPMIIVGGMLHKNPFFVEPAEFLRELHARKAKAPTVSL